MSNLSKSCISTDVDGRYSDTEKTNSAVIEAYRTSRDFAVVCPEVEHCVFQVSLFTFFFLALFLQRRILLGKRKCLHSEVNSHPPARSPPPTKHTHKHTADGVSVTFQNVNWFSMLVGWRLKWLWGAFTYLRNGVIIPDGCIQQWEAFWEKYTLILPILKKKFWLAQITTNERWNDSLQADYCSLPAV